jgi:polar amino acid transport system substrate-binding protein
MIRTFRPWPMLAIALLLVLSAPAAQAELDEIHLTTVDWAPFYSEDEPDNGFITEIARVAFDRAGYATRIDFIPWARAVYDVDQGVRHVLLGAYYTDERAERFIASDRMYTTQIGLVTRRDVGVREYDSLRDLMGYDIGYGRGWATSAEFDNADYLNRIPEDDNVLNVRKLYAERIDMVAMNFDRFLAIAAEEGLDPDRGVFVEPPLDENGLYLMASRAIPQGEQIIADFNRELAAMREDGTYDAILADFGLR